MWRSRNGFVALATVVLLGTQGCAAVGLTLFGVGAGVSAGTGTQYTLDSIAYRTFTAPLDEMRRATLATFRRMDIALQSDDSTAEGRSIIGQAADRTIDIELESLTSRTTRMRVTAKQGWFFRDRATAGEIIAQTERSLDDLPAVSQKTR
ncbi:MAG: DUF3568 family protein [candidate division NC10 bacterium]